MPSAKFFKHLAHPPPVQRHNEPIIVLVTVCSEKRRAVLDSDRVMRALVAVWTVAGDWLVGSYMIMPDHVHFFCSPADRYGFPPLRRWVGYWKRLAGKEEPMLRRAFQEDCWDTQMRTQEHYLIKLERESGKEGTGRMP